MSFTPLWSQDLGTKMAVKLKPSRMSKAIAVVQLFAIHFMRHSLWMRTFVKCINVNGCLIDR